jgi:hypothetical protein
MSSIADPTTLFAAIARALGGGVATALMTTIVVILLSLTRMPKLAVMSIGASFSTLLAAGTIEGRLLRGASIAVAALLIGAVLGRRTDPDEKAPFHSFWFIFLPIGMTVLAMVVVLASNGTAPGTFPRWSNTCSVAAALGVATALLYEPRGRLGRSLLVVITGIVAAIANGVVDLYVPLWKLTPVSATTIPVASVARPFTITSQGGVLSVTLPVGVALPSRRDTVVVGAYGRVPTTLYISAEPSGDTFLVSLGSLPKETFTSYTSSQILDTWRDNTLVAMSAQAISQEELTLTGHEGRRVYCESADSRAPLFGRMECFIVRPYLCLVGYVGEHQDSLARPSVQLFFASIHLNDVALPAQ